MAEINSNQNEFIQKEPLITDEQNNAFMLLEPDVLKTLYGDQIVADNPQIVKQRSQEWHDLRQLSKVTSSTMHNALGFRTLKLQKEHYDCFIKKTKVPSPVTEAMQHSIDNEVR